MDCCDGESSAQAERTKQVTSPPFDASLRADLLPRIRIPGLLKADQLIGSRSKAHKLTLGVLCV